MAVPDPGWTGCSSNSASCLLSLSRFIVPDRPGLGLSDFLAGRTIRGWAEDARELADALELPSFAVLGVSGGGPYAAACAHELPDRVSRVAMVSGLAPFQVRGK